MTRGTLLLLLAALLSVFGCTAVTVSQDYDTDADLSGYDSWGWRVLEQPPTGDARIDNPLLDQRIRSAVDNHLAGRNINPADTLPDLLLSYHLAIERKIYSNTYASSMGVGGYYRPWYGDVGTETRVYQYDQCRLIIDIVSAQTGNLLWRGEGVYLFTTYQTPQEASAAMQQIVDRIVEQFPPDR